MDTNRERLCGVFAAEYWLSLQITYTYFHENVSVFYLKQTNKQNKDVISSRILFCI